MPAQTRILHVADFSPDYGGNFIASLRSLHARLAADDHATGLMLPPSAEQKSWVTDMRSDGVYLAFGPVSGPGAKQAIEQVVSDWKPDLIHSHFASPDLPVWFASRKAPHGRPILVRHHHNLMWNQRLRWLKDTLKHRLMGKGVTNIAVSGAIEDSVRSRVPEVDIITIENGVDVNRFPGGSESSSFRSEWKIGDKTVFLAFGWDYERKGIDLLIEAFQASDRLQSGALLAIAGPGDMQSKAREAAGEPDWLKLLEPTREIAALYAAGDCFVLSSRREGLSYAVIEAMLSEKVLISSRIEGMEWAADHAGILSFASESVPGLTEAMARVLEMSDEQRAQLGKENRAFAAEEFSLTRWTDRVLDVYSARLGEKLQGLSKTGTVNP